MNKFCNFLKDSTKNSRRNPYFTHCSEKTASTSRCLFGISTNVYPKCYVYLFRTNLPFLWTGHIVRRCRKPQGYSEPHFSPLLQPCYVDLVPVSSDKLQKGAVRLQILQTMPDTLESPAAAVTRCQLHAWRGPCSAVQSPLCTARALSRFRSDLEAEQLPQSAD